MRVNSDLIGDIRILLKIISVPPNSSIILFQLLFPVLTGRARELDPDH